MEIPETVELIGNEAFARNTKLFRFDLTLNNDRFKIVSDKTIMI